MSKLRELLDVALFPIERPDFFINAPEYFDIIERTVKEWLTQKRLDLQEPEYNPSTYQGSYAMLGREQMIDELVAELQDKNKEDNGGVKA
jgi:hypothetical protein